MLGSDAVQLLIAGNTSCTCTRRPRTYGCRSDVFQANPAPAVPTPRNTTTGSRKNTHQPFATNAPRKNPTC
ncbi:hypothetical protein K440DRAFT_628534 [Wilcoxina mikolae CBS 423.85]|nr:hypothetical protein K440DRAFT_628534 [Wilcoxina mikolae CBS 423.85]